MSSRRYTVPTHLAVEPPVVRFIVGLTLRQFICLAVGAGFAYLVIKRLHLGGPQLLLAAAIVGLALVIAFVQVGGRPAERWLRDRLAFQSTPRLRLWRPPVLIVPPPPTGAWVARSVQVIWRQPTNYREGASIAPLDQRPPSCPPAAPSRRRTV